MDKKELATKSFCDGCNCCQAVVDAFLEETGLEKEATLRLASSFGAGIGGLMEVCGAVSGMCMVLGAAKGYGKETTPAEKSLHYARIREAAARFTDKYGSLLCRDLKKDENRVFCKELVGFAAEVTEEFLQN